MTSISEFQQTLKLIRMANKRISMARAAEMSGMSAASWARYEKGGRLPKEESLEALIDAFPEQKNQLVSAYKATYIDLHGKDPNLIHDAEEVAHPLVGHEDTSVGEQLESSLGDGHVELEASDLEQIRTDMDRLNSRIDELSAALIRLMGQR